MSKKIQFIGQFLMISCIILFLYSCEKNDYVVGGKSQDVNIYKNMSNYDMLKSNPAFDTLVQVIDAAGVKDVINAQGTTFFAPSDYSISVVSMYRIILTLMENLDWIPCCIMSATILTEQRTRY